MASTRIAIAVCSAALIGVLVGGLAVRTLMPPIRYHGIPAPLFDQTYFYNHGMVGPAETFHGVWIDGFEESRYFPDIWTLPTREIPRTTARLQMDDASRNLVHRYMAEPLRPGCSDILAIRFRGNAVKPNHGIGFPGYLETIYVPTEVLTVRPLRRIC